MIFQQDIIHQSDSLSYSFSAQDFELDFWLEKSDTVLLSGGRGGSLKITIDRQDFVLHRYLRGGLIARLLQDRYWWMGQSLSRPQVEFLVVENARQQHLPVPEMVAFYVSRKGPWYRAASISRYQENQGTLAEYIATKPLAAEYWSSLGGLIRQLHATGICHVDLNANNILLDHQSNFHLIDFDKAKLNQSGNSWKSENLDRLKRSLLKIQAILMPQQKPFYFSEQEWERLIDGYQSR